MKLIQEIDRRLKEKNYQIYLTYKWNQKKLNDNTLSFKLTPSATKTKIFENEYNLDIQSIHHDSIKDFEPMDVSLIESIPFIKYSDRNRYIIFFTSKNRKWYSSINFDDIDRNFNTNDEKFVDEIFQFLINEIKQTEN